MSELKIGEMLLQSGSLTKHQLNDALARQTTKGGLLGEILIELGYVHDENLIKALQHQRKSKITDNLNMMQ